MHAQNLEDRCPSGLHCYKGHVTSNFCDKIFCPKKNSASSVGRFIRLSRSYILQEDLEHFPVAAIL